MDKRLQLHEIFLSIPGVKEAYFQPPSTLDLVYPCIIYSRKKNNTDFANDKPYNHHTAYQVIVIDEDPDSGIPMVIASMPMSSFDRHYTADNLNHDVYNVYF